MRFPTLALLLAALASSFTLACGSTTLSSNDDGGASTQSDAGATDGNAEAGAFAWVELGLDGSVPDAIAIDPKTPSTIYIGLAAGSAEKGFFRSEDNGKTWTKMTGGLPDTFAGALAVHPQHHTVLANPGSSGIWRSTDGGDSWSSVNGGLLGANAFLFHPTLDTAWTVNSHEGVYRSTDGGASFTKTANTGLPLNQFDLGPLAYDGSKLYLATDSNGVYVSTDDGDSWTHASGTGLPSGFAGGMLNIAATPSRPGVIFVQTRSSGILRSSDAGATFTKLDTGSNPTRFGALRMDPSNPKTIYVSADDAAGSSGGLLMSTNDGQSFSAIGPNALEVDAMDVAPDGTIFAGTIGKGMWRYGK